MRKKFFLILFLLLFAAEIVIALLMIRSIRIEKQDTVAFNSCRKEIEMYYGKPESYPEDLAYTIIDNEGTVLHHSKGGASDSVNAAAQNNDAVYDLEVGGEMVGKVIFKTRVAETFDQAKKKLTITIVVFSALEVLVMALYYLHLRRKVVRPFEKLNDFAVRVAGGNLDIPLDMDRGHVFGSFTEAFDLMRSELKKAQIAEKKANDEKKETIAKLSHDIKTPVASIKATSELGYALAGEERVKESFRRILEKSDQVTTLTDNLFQSSVQDVTIISVNPTMQRSLPIEGLIRNADYMNMAGDFSIPDCMVFMDKLRLQQVLDNIFVNSYKYADTPIEVGIRDEEDYLLISVKDHGPGVKKEDLAVLKEKYRRGSNTAEKEGAGLGLYLADYFMKQMNGKLELLSEDGFTAEIYLRKN